MMSLTRVLAQEELATLGCTFVALGVRKIRFTGGNSLVRQDIV